MINHSMITVLQFIENGDHQVGGIASLPLALGLFLSISFLVALCAKHALRQVSQNLDEERTSQSQSSAANDNFRLSPKKLIKRISSSKAVPLEPKRTDGECNDNKQSGGEEDGGFGEGGLWQKSILMGDKCRPPEFPGAIYYDSLGKQVSEMPRSPKTSHLPSFRVPVVQDAS